MTTKTFRSAKDAKFLKIQPCEILEINGYNVSLGYINITNRHVTVEDYKGVKVLTPPFKIKYIR